MTVPPSTFWNNEAWRTGPLPRLSVVFPTYRRLDTLGCVLDALATQTGLEPGQFEIVVCDDASGDNTPQLLRDATARGPHPMACLSLARQGGPARARNAALQLVRAPVVLLLGDDILPPPDLVARHVAWHAAHPDPTEALLGYTTWAETPPPNALMLWLQDGGRQFAFAYRDLTADRPVSGYSFYTCHVSFKGALLKAAGGFDEAFPFPSQEDLELGLRMERQGMRLHYDPTLIAYHRHWMDLPSVSRRVYRNGYCSVRFWSTGVLPSSMARALARRVLYGLFALPPLRRLCRRLPDRTDPEFRHTRSLRWTIMLLAIYWSGAADAAHGRKPVPEELIG